MYDNPKMLVESIIRVHQQQQQQRSKAKQSFAQWSICIEIQLASHTLGLIKRQTIMTCFACLERCLAPLLFTEARGENAESEENVYSY